MKQKVDYSSRHIMMLDHYNREKEELVLKCSSFWERKPNKNLSTRKLRMKNLQREIEERQKQKKINEAATFQSAEWNFSRQLNNNSTIYSSTKPNDSCNFIIKKLV